MSGSEGKRPKRRGRKEPGEGKHSWNSCGSEARKDERKRTESRVREAVEARAETAHRGDRCEVEPGRAERKKQRLSSETLKRKRTKESGCQAPAPEEKSKRGSPVERLRE